MAAIPPCYRVQFGGPELIDQPLLPDGQPVPARVDNNASLAAEPVRAYVRAMITDLCRAYPEADGLKFDWPEYPPYHFLSLFADYNPQVHPYAEQIGIDFDRLKRAMADFLGNVREGRLPASLFDAPLDFDDLLDRLRAHFPALTDHLALRAHLVESYAAFLRSCVDEASGGTKRLVLQGFPPPWNRLSGFDPQRLEQHTARLAIKFYTMHWPMMLKNYAEHVLDVMPGAGAHLGAALPALLLSPDAPQRSIADMRYPEPDEPHGVSRAIITSKYAEAQKQTRRPIIGISHAYGPCEDVVDRFEAVWTASHGHAEINRYCYMSDDKIKPLQHSASGAVYRADCQSKASRKSG